MILFASVLIFLLNLSTCDDQKIQISDYRNITLNSLVKQVEFVPPNCQQRDFDFLKNIRLFFPNVSGIVTTCCPVSDVIDGVWFRCEKMEVQTTPTIAHQLNQTLAPIYVYLTPPPVNDSNNSNSEFTKLEWVFIFVAFGFLIVITVCCGYCCLSRRYPTIFDCGHQTGQQQNDGNQMEQQNNAGNYTQHQKRRRPISSIFDPYFDRGNREIYSGRQNLRKEKSSFATIGRSVRATVPPVSCYRAQPATCDEQIENELADVIIPAPAPLLSI